MDWTLKSRSYREKSLKDYKYLKKNKKKICLVSPDLLGKKNEILKYIKYLKSNPQPHKRIRTKIYNTLTWEGVTTCFPKNGSSNTKYSVWHLCE